MSDLEDLARELHRAFAHPPGVSHDWRDSRAMSEALDRLRAAFGDKLADRAGPRSNRALLAFRLTPETVAFADLKLVCRAIARPADWEQRRLIDDDRLFATLLARVEALRPEPRRHQACLSALRAALTECPERQADTCNDLTGNVRRLVDWLAAQ